MMPAVADRGTRWVVAQFALMGVAAVGWLAGPRIPALKVPGTILALAGVVVALWASRTMGRSLTPFPRPREDGELIQDGPFRFVRHPVYAGGILFFAGVSLAVGVWGLAGTAALAPLWWFKARYEEGMLLDRYPEYAAYRERVRGRLVPRP
jgi:protein-S-isoprenylcysteine O-methyltransferase Ste14